MTLTSARPLCVAPHGVTTTKDDRTAFVACYGSGRLHFNLFRLGHKWFEQGLTEEVDRLLIHEFGHQYSGDHLSEELALSKPESFQEIRA